jgi:hypothetical protein
MMIDEMNPLDPRPLSRNRAGLLNRPSHSNYGNPAMSSNLSLLSEQKTTQQLPRNNPTTLDYSTRILLGVVLTVAISHHGQTRQRGRPL